MRQATLRKGVVMGALLMGAVLLLSPATSFAAPSLGADCGAGASVVGSDGAGKVTLGTGVAGNTCTLTFTVTLLNEPACTAVNETNSGGHPGPVGTKSMPTTLVLDGNGSKAASLTDRDVVSYLYVGY